MGSSGLSAQGTQRCLRFTVDQLEQGLRGGLHSEAVLLPVAQRADRDAKQAGEGGLRQAEPLADVLGQDGRYEAGFGVRVLTVLDHLLANVGFAGTRCFMYLVILPIM